jgi:hypothetical protein
MGRLRYWRSFMGQATLLLFGSVCCLQPCRVFSAEPVSELLQPNALLSNKGPEELLFEQAKKLEGERQWIEAKYLYRQLVETGRDPRWIQKATWQLVLIAEARSEDETELRYLKEAIKFPADGSLQRSVHDQAEKKLGWFYLRQNQFAEARTVIKDWKSRSFCGNCAAFNALHHGNILTYCRLHLGEQREVAEELFLAIDRPRPNPYLLGHEKFTSFQAQLLFEMYRSAGQLPDLLERLSHDTDLPPHVIEQVEVQRLFEARDRAGLFERCFAKPDRAALQSKFSKGTQRAAIEAYLRVAGNDLAPFRKLLNTPGAAHEWAIYALGKAGTPYARDLLFELLEDRTNGMNLAQLVYAIHLHGPEALERWRKHRFSKVFQLDEEAKHALLLERPLPKFPPGSLPK